MELGPEGDRERQLAWIAGRLRIPADRIAASATWRCFPGSVDSLDLIELVFVLEKELEAGHRERG